MTNNFYSSWSDCPSHPSYNIILPIMYAMHHFLQLSSLWRKNLLVRKSCLRIDKKWRSRTDSNGQYEWTVTYVLLASGVPHFPFTYLAGSWRCSMGKIIKQGRNSGRQVCRRKKWISATLRKTSGCARDTVFLLNIVSYHNVSLTVY